MVSARQAGTLIDDELKVSLGPRSTWRAYLDSVSADRRALSPGWTSLTLVTQVEPILVNGCSVDPYLEFATSDGDYLQGQVRASWFPESPFVLFREQLTCVLDTCNPVSLF